MAVAHVTSSQSHASASFSVSQASFSWTHTTTTNPQGVLVLVFQGVSATDAVTSVTYDGVTVPAVSGGRATDTATEPGSVAAYFLGSGVPATDNPTVVVNRTNNTTSMWATCVTVTAGADTQAVGVVLTQNDGAIVEQSVDDGSNGQNSVRYAGVYYGGATPAPAGANSTLLHSNDAGAYGWTAVRETTAGQGARSVGCTQATSDDRAGVHLAVQEIVPTPVTARHSGTSGTSAVQTLATNSTTPSADSLLLVFAAAQPDNVDLAHSWQAPTGGSLTYTAVDTSAQFNWETTLNFKIQAAMWRATVGATPSAHTVTVDAWSTTQAGTYSAVACDVTGYNTSSPVVQTKTGGGTVNPTSSSASGAVTFDSALTTGSMVVVGYGAGNDVAGAFGTPSLGGRTMHPLHNLTGNYTHAGMWYLVIDGSESNATITCPDLGETVGNWAAVAVEVAAASTGGATATPAMVAAAASVPSATLQAGAEASPAAVGATAAIPTPGVTVGTNATITPSTVTAVSSIPAAVLKAGSVVAAAAVAAVALISGPSVSTGADATAAPAAVATTSQVPAPGVQAGAKAVPAAVSAVASIPAPLLAHRYITAVSSNGRYFVDQNGTPILVRGDSPWAMFTDLSSSEMDTYLQNRVSFGTNLMLVSMVGSVANGAPNDNGATYDGILPFTGGNPTVFNSTYWSRMDSYITKARNLGVTLMIYPMDGWNCTFGGTVFDPGAVTNTQCQTYGNTLATRYLSYPNIIWAFGGDYNEDSTINARFNACLTGIRAAGDTRPVTIQLDPEKSLSDDSTFWEPIVDFNFVYTYFVTYKGMKDGYDHVWSVSPTTRPALWSEGAYENSFDPHPGTDLVIRRQAGWALTSGSPGEFTGQEGVWNFNADWPTRINTTAASQLKAIRDAFQGLAWWTLIPDDANQLVTAGRGTRITTDSATYPTANTYVTAARAADGTLAVIYMPTASSAITVDMTKIGANPTATWVDPTNGATVSATPGSSYSRGNNAAGSADWLLVLTGDAGETVTPASVAAVVSIPAPVVKAGATVAPASIAGPAAVPAPALTSSTVVQPGAVTANTSILAPTVGTGATVAAGTVQAVAAVPAPAVSAGGSAAAAPAAVTTVASIPTAGVATGSRVSVSFVAAVTAIPAPTVTAGSGVAVTATTAAAVAAVPAPAILLSVAPATVGIVASIPAPTLQASTLVTVATVTAVAAIPSPTVLTFIPVTERPFTGITTRPDTGITPRP